MNTNVQAITNELFEEIKVLAAAQGSSILYSTPDFLSELIQHEFPEFEQLIEKHGVEAIQGLRFANGHELRQTPDHNGIIGAGWEEVSDGSQHIYTNRYLTDISGSQPHLNWQENLSPNPSLTVERVTGLLNNTQWTTEPLSIAGIQRRNGGADVVILAGSEGAAHISKPYFQYFASKFSGDLEFRQSVGGNMIQVISNNQMVGMCATANSLNCLKDSNDLKQLEEIKASIFETIMRRPLRMSSLSPNGLPFTAKLTEAAPAAPELAPVEQTQQLSSANTEQSIEQSVEAQVGPADEAPRDDTALDKTLESFEEGADTSPVDPNVYQDASSNEVQDWQAVLGGEKAPSGVPGPEQDMGSGAEQPAHFDAPMRQEGPDTVFNASMSGASVALGQSVAEQFPHISKEAYEALLAERLSEAVSEEHVRNIVRQETYALTKNSLLANQRAEYFDALHKRIVIDREDALEVLICNISSSMSKLFSSKNPHRNNLKRQPIENGLDMIEGLIDASQIDPSNERAPVNVIDVEKAQTLISEGSKDIKSLDDIKNFDPRTSFGIDPVYIGENTLNKVNKLQPELLLDENNTVDEDWVSRMGSKINRIKEKLSTSTLDASSRKAIKELMESIGQALNSMLQLARGLAEAFKKLIQPQEDQHKIDDKTPAHEASM